MFLNVVFASIIPTWYAQRKEKLLHDIVILLPGDDVA